ncbi:MAG: hypothetical protein PHH59_01130 [Methylovulum sp.]|uniref:hypothetical protein n=1 Tax=Methylovulum sp. TaxID=1916980 RepID=UPI002629B385|nr:hypothetical protein [Methylovulum sp.]MDD2722610.1 hypothetical protein [Methylovulum sp.]MDD5123792.1 hypothetical protein [Methylovulum sp.]
MLAKTELFEYGGSNENFTSTVMHEMGHTAGLEHEGGVQWLAYWLGCIVDPLDVSAEKFEGNNATYVEIKIN